MPSKDIYYSDKYTDDKFEYRHVMLPKVKILKTQVLGLYYTYQVEYF